MANEAAIKAGIGSLATSNVFHLMAGIELRSSGDMTLMQDPRRRIRKSICTICATMVKRPC